MSERIPHDEYKEEIAGGTIPFNFDEGPHDGVKCQNCEEISPEEAYDWIDTVAYREETETGGVRYDVQSVRLRCPECGDAWTAYMG